MASSSTEIANMALSHIGVGKEIASLDEASAEARACNRFYENALKETLRDARWGFAIKVADLGLIEEDPTEEWAYSYTYPSDCLKFLKIQTGERNENAHDPASYVIVRGSSSSVIYTDVEDAVCEYVRYEEDVARYPADFVTAMSLRLAYLIAPRILKEPSPAIQQALGLRYHEALQQAAANNYNEQQPDAPPDDELISGRE